MDPFLGQIKLFAFSFPPRGWALCEGQILPIAQNQALFSLLGTTYGGNGQTTFALPDLRGRVAVSSTGIGSDLGFQYGAQAVTLNQTQIPAHTHTVQTGLQATEDDAVGNYPAITGGHLSYGATDGSTMDATVIANAGGSQPHENQMPSLGMNYCIALQGIFPSRN